MNILLVVTHPNKDSLTFAVMQRFLAGLQTNEHNVDVIDLYRHSFDPALSEEDEPAWKLKGKQFSPEIQKEMERIQLADALVFIFPLWWYSMPAMLKGYFDKVVNFKFNGQKKLLWITLAGATKHHLVKYGNHQLISQYFNQTIAGWLQAGESSTEFLYDTLSGSKVHIQSLLDEAFQMGKQYR
ncbi:NAD(P)H oxidoreductase [Evansella halocellulosilytica]|uniref:NAD(P)H oxidoreductase n=1 Tax=Evansella halocellulosilytica TaxID=2011013 RepID=UPI000BB84264|nr:NAD(P)H oxidoreductase [Evansella halocellulosilytica]